MKPILLFLFTICYTQLSFGQGYYSVIAKNGLIIREKPSISSKKIGKLEAGRDVGFIECTNTAFSVIDNGKKINGHWFKVATVRSNGSHGLIGYVFSGYLLKKGQGQNVDIVCQDSNSCNAKIGSKNFEATIFHYNIDSVTKKGDTLEVFETVFNEVSDKLINIKPKTAVDSVRVFYTLSETIQEQFNHMTSTLEQEKWEKTKASWKGNDPFIQLKNTNDFFRIPITKYEKQEKYRKQQLKLKDTLVDLSGESWNIATLIYKNKACTYGIDAVVLKIVLYHKNKAIEEKYIKLILSYGC